LGDEHTHEVKKQEQIPFLRLKFLSYETFTVTS
jgi:hypothetical protein